MRIGIDARLYGNKHTGLGRYIQNLIHNLAKVDKKNTYLIFAKQEVSQDIKNYKNFQFIELKTPVYSLAEQFINPFVFAKAKLDILHVPHFNAPIIYFGRLVITIHDLIKHVSIGKNTTTHTPCLYWFKYFFYRLVVFINIKKAKAIITPTIFWRDYLINHYNLSAKKVFVTYEAADKALMVNFKVEASKILNKYKLKKPFVIYTGNLYPHKNVNFLIKTINKFNQKHKHQLFLGIVSARSSFSKNLATGKNIHRLGYVPDSDLAVLYSQGLALIQPSFIEGFGLTGLEAMANNLPVLSSDATCLPEVYRDAALYFDPYDRQSLMLRLEQILEDHDLAERLKKKGRKRVKKFSWDRTAKQTIKAYKAV